MFFADLVIVCQPSVDPTITPVQITNNIISTITIRPRLRSAPATENAT